MEFIITKFKIMMFALMAYFLPIVTIMIAVISLITIDTIMGVMASHKEGLMLTSRRFADVLVKMFTYNLLVITAHIINVTLVDFIPFVQITLLFIATTEFYSIAENFGRITGTDFNVYLREKIKDFFKNKTR